jgi:hypothetical protein
MEEVAVGDGSAIAVRVRRNSKQERYVKELRCFAAYDLALSALYQRLPS